MTRAKDQARIDFLAQARNRALEPLWLNNSMATSTSLLLPHDMEVGCLVKSAFCPSSLKHCRWHWSRAVPNDIRLGVHAVLAINLAAESWRAFVLPLRKLA